MQATDPALGFGSATVLSDLNISIPKGQMTALIGTGTEALSPGRSPQFLHARSTTAHH
jgi:hypothetical protein